MKKSFIFLCLAFIIHIDVWGQYTDVSIERADSLSSMANFYSSTHNYKMAIDLEKQSLEMKKKLYGNHSVEYILSVSNLAGYYYLSGEYNNAIEYGEESVKLYSLLGGKNTVEYPELLSILVEYHHKNGTYQKMIEYQKEISDIYINLYGKDIQHYALSQANLSSFYSEIGDYSNAIEAAEKGLEVYRDSAEKKDINYIYALSNLSNLYYTRNYLAGGDWAKSLKLKEEVVKLAAENFGVDNLIYAIWLSDLAFLHLHINGNDKRGQQYVQEAKKLYEKNKEKDEAACLGLLANLAISSELIGDNESAIEYNLTRLKLLDEHDISYSTCLDDIARSYAKINDFGRASIYLLHSLKSIRNIVNNSNNDKDLFRQYLYWNASNLFNTLVKYVSKNPTDSAVAMLYDEAINTRTLRLRNGKGEWYTWKDVKSHLNDNEIAIEFVNYSSIEENNVYIYALIVKKNQDLPKLIRVSDDNEFKDSLLCATSKYDQDHKLGQIVWGRLAEELGGVKNIYFTPTWTLVAMSAEYFPVNEKQYYNEIYNMYRLSSIRELVERDQDDNHYSNAVLYGGLTYEDAVEGQKADNRSGFEPLINTKIEIDEISNILRNNAVKTIELSGNNGTEQSVRNLSGTDTDILHIATHGGFLDKEQELRSAYVSSLNSQYSPNDEVHANSFLVMSGANFSINKEEFLNTEEDGLLTASEISKLDLHKIKMLVLSACETARGNYGTDDMIWGVQRGFKEAGVKSILMSLRKVDDEATKILMVEFYKNLMSGKTKLQSLKDTQKYLRQVDNGKYDDPQYWASFILLDGLN